MLLIFSISYWVFKIDFYFWTQFNNSDWHNSAVLLILGIRYQVSIIIIYLEWLLLISISIINLTNGNEKGGDLARELSCNQFGPFRYQLVFSYTPTTFVSEYRSIPTVSCSFEFLYITTMRTNQHTMVSLVLLSQLS